MDFKFFTDLIDALGKVCTGLNAPVQLHQTERETIRSMDETYRLIDTKLNMVIIRLGDVRASTSDHDYIQLEAGELEVREAGERWHQRPSWLDAIARGTQIETREPLQAVEQRRGDARKALSAPVETTTSR